MGLPTSYDLGQISLTCNTKVYDIITILLQQFLLYRNSITAVIILEALQNCRCVIIAIPNKYP